MYVDLPFSSEVSCRGLRSSVSSHTAPRRTCFRAYSFLGMHISCMRASPFFPWKTVKIPSKVSPRRFLAYLFNMIYITPVLTSLIITAQKHAIRPTLRSLRLVVNYRSQELPKKKEQGAHSSRFLGGQRGGGPYGGHGGDEGHESWR